MTMSSCTCEPTETTQSIGDDTRAVETSQRGRESGPGGGVIFCVGGLGARPIDRCSNKDAGMSECETPTLCESSAPKIVKEEETDRQRDKRVRKQQQRNKVKVKENTHGSNYTSTLRIKLLHHQASHADNDPDPKQQEITAFLFVLCPLVDVLDGLPVCQVVYYSSICHVVTLKEYSKKIRRPEERFG